MDAHYQRKRQQDAKSIAAQMFGPHPSMTKGDLDRYYYERAERQRKFKAAFNPYDNNPYAMAPDPDRWSRQSAEVYTMPNKYTPEEREYEMRRSEVVKQLGPPPDARDQFNRWVEALRDDAPPVEILGASINMRLESTRHGVHSTHKATVVRGYRILSVVLQGARPPEVGVLACYSPLLKDLVGEGFHIDCGYSELEFCPRVELYLSCLPDLKREAVEPLTDMQSKRIVFYMHLSRSRYDTKQTAELYHRALHPRIDPCWLLDELLLPPDRDPVLAAAGYLKSYPAATLQKLWADYDAWGPIDNLYGQAMIHLDKFRSW